MATQKQTPPELPPMTEDERAEWRKLRRKALHALIIKHDGERMKAPGTANLAGEYAYYSILDERRRFPR
jgi:hypothetical protein